MTYQMGVYPDLNTPIERKRCARFRCCYPNRTCRTWHCCRHRRRCRTWSPQGAQSPCERRPHFVGSMGAASLLGAVLGALRFETFWITVHAGILGATLVASGVLAIRFRAQGTKRWFVAVAGVNALNAAALFGAGWYATKLPDTRLFSFAAEDYLFLFGMAAIALGGDLRLTLGAHTTDRHRIAQHLIRMCIGFFIAAGSAFTGPGASAFPQALQNSGLLSLPELTIVVLMLFWIWKTLNRPGPMFANR